MSQRLELTWFNKDQALIPTETGKYGYTWVDPRDPRYCETRPLVIDDVITGQQTLQRDDVTYGPRADLQPTTDNLLIHGESGDVLEALTRVPELAEKYLGQVKLIYIDPPFNTGDAFTSYEDNLEHSIWLTMMRDRLQHMKRLLRRDGSIWVHLDDNENHRMRVLLDEVFGPGNFIAEVVWRKRASVANDSRTFTNQQDYLIAYGRSPHPTINRVPRALTKDDARYRAVDGDPRLWGSFGNTSAPRNLANGRQVAACYGIQHPLTGEILYPPRGGQWAFRAARIRASLDEYAEWREVEPDVAQRCALTGLTQSEVRMDVKDLKVVDIEDARRTARARIEAGVWPEFFVQEATFGRKVYQSEDRTSPPPTWWPDSVVGHSRQAKGEIEALFPGESAFSTPKPERLLERVIHIGSNPGDIVLDVFAGSGTTPAVAHKMGRRWVACELREDNFTRYALPRLTKVVNDGDPGGITASVGERTARDGVKLPDGVSPDRAAQITGALDAAARHCTAEVDLAEQLAKMVRKDIKGEAPVLEAAEAKTLLKTLAKLRTAGIGTQDVLPLARTQTKKQLATEPGRTIVNWRGGGGFTVAHLGPACFDCNPETGQVVLTEAADDHATLVTAVAAQLKFPLTPHNPHFHGRRGNSWLHVTYRPLTQDTIHDIVAHLPDGHTVTIASTTVLDGAAQAAREAARGSRVVHIPGDLFPTVEGGQR